MIPRLEISYFGLLILDKGITNLRGKDKDKSFPREGVDGLMPVC